MNDEETRRVAVLTADQAAHRDELIKRVTRLLVEVEDINDEIASAHQEDARAWTSFDMERNTRALASVKSLLEDMTDRLLLQVGRWPEILQPGVTWAQVKAKIRKR